MMGSFVNGAVDKTFLNRQGKFKFVVTVPGEPQLPAGGMKPPKDKDTDTYEAARKTLLNEFLEEENGRLFESGTHIYDEINDVEAFKNTLLGCINHDKFKTLDTMLPGIHDALELAIEADGSNSQKLRAVIECIEQQTQGKDIEPNSDLERMIHELKAMVQLETFKLHQMYNEALKFILENSEVVEINQVNDLRRTGGFQISTTFILKKPLEEFFESKQITSFTAGDDMTGGKYEDKTMLEVLNENVRFSHPLAALKCQMDCLNPIFRSKVMNKIPNMVCQGSLV